jgi:hypothetical protein
VSGPPWPRAHLARIGWEQTGLIGCSHHCNPCQVRRAADGTSSGGRFAGFDGSGTYPMGRNSGNSDIDWASCDCPAAQAARGGHRTVRAQMAEPSAGCLEAGAGTAVGKARVVSPIQAPVVWLASRVAPQGTILVTVNASGGLLIAVLRRSRPCWRRNRNAGYSTASRCSSPVRSHESRVTDSLLSVTHARAALTRSACGPPAPAPRPPHHRSCTQPNAP